MLIVNQVIPHALKRKTDYIFILFATQISIQVVLLFFSKIRTEKRTYTIQHLIKCLSEGRSNLET